MPDASRRVSQRDSTTTHPYPLVPGFSFFFAPLALWSSPRSDCLPLLGRHPSSLLHASTSWRWAATGELCFSPPPSPSLPRFLSFSTTSMAPKLRATTAAFGDPCHISLPASLLTHQRPPCHWRWVLRRSFPKLYSSSSFGSGSKGCGGG